MKALRTTLLLADDHALMRAGLRALLGGVAHCEVIAEAADGIEAARLIRQLQPGVALPRRSMLKGLAVGLLPVVVSIAVPPAAAAASCLPDGDSCFSSTECCSGNCATYYGSSYPYSYGICQPNF